MRIIAVSDSHGCSGLLRKAVEQATRFARVDVFVHCGDGMRDMGAAGLVPAGDPRSGLRATIA